MSDLKIRHFFFFLSQYYTQALYSYTDVTSSINNILPILKCLVVSSDKETVLQVVFYLNRIAAFYNNEQAEVIVLKYHAF